MRINNDFYDTLGQRWYEAQDDPVALLRAEARYRNPHVLAALRHNFDGADCRVLDVGCGGGFLSNYLAAAGYQVCGVDLSEESLAVARGRDGTGTVEYRRADARSLPYPPASFDAVACMDFLEHIEDASSVIAESARVLRAGGLFFFHTFNRNPLSWLIALKAVEWFVPNTPPRMHVFHLFMKPAELSRYCRRHGLSVVWMRGVRPVWNMAVLRMLFTRRVPAEFEFKFSNSLLLAYSGMARKVS